MEGKVENLVRYWRTSLADSALGRGKLTAGDMKKCIALSAGTIERGRVSQRVLDRVFESKPDSVDAITVKLRPMLVQRRLEHGASRHDGLPERVTPIITEAVLGRDGLLRPRRTVIARDLLDPMPAEAFSIGTVHDLDTFLTNSLAHDEAQCADGGPQWKAYLRYCMRMMDEAANGWPKDDQNYELVDGGLIEEAEETSQVSRRVIGLYDHILKTKPAAPLLRSYAIDQSADPVPCLPKQTDFSKRLGHSNDRFPLADHQRDVLAHLAVAKNGEILAVNGPPGTGKTTLLLSVVAGEWVRAALAGGPPPVIVAASSNNQAVTNIIDAFGKDFAVGEGPFAGRWLPEIKSFGLFLPSQMRRKDAARNYQTEDFHDLIETEAYVHEARQAYLDAAQKALPPHCCSGPGDIVSALRRLIQEDVEKLSALDEARQALDAASMAMATELGDCPEREHAERQGQRDVAAVGHAELKQVVECWEQYLADESFFFSLLKFLPPVATKRTLKARLFLRELGEAAANAGERACVEEMEVNLRAQLKDQAAQLQACEQHLARASQLIEAQRRAQEKLTAAVRNLGADDSCADDMAALDRWVDCAVRFRLFLLATHYWEGRWLLEMEEGLPTIEAQRGKRGRKTIEPRWHRRMMITPCAVATFLTLPEKLLVSSFDNNQFTDDYLYNFIDLLIVDEAGQVSPEVAAPSFALAKKALVIGDTQQIAPISAIPKTVDIGNLRANNLLSPMSSAKDYHDLASLGVTAAVGSVMRIAQAVCRYHPHTELERGLYLFEHRRCYDEIISFCNALCYKGALRPKRGIASAEALLRPLSYLHIDGRCIASGGSRINWLEAQTIAAWLADNRIRLEEHYKLPLGKIVAVVTPFGGQVRAIRQACGEKGIKIGSDENGMTVGTIHSLQGAERPLVIFSPVYSKHADGTFIDNSPSMLNVAVSRAKDSFLVFGDMDVFSSARRGTPRALLASHLFSDPGNALQFEIPARRDLLRRSTQCETLRDAEQHDAFLLAALSGKAEEIHIVSPWIVMRNVESAGIFEGLKQACSNGIRVLVYTDPKLNANRQWKKDSAGPDPLAQAADRLRKIGVEFVQVGKTHSKIVMVDDHLLCIGSYNWLSASRDGDYARHETSLVYRGTHLEEEISLLKASLESRRLRG